MLSGGRNDGNLAGGYAKQTHEGKGVVVCSTGSAEARHGDTHDSLAVQSHLIECEGGHEQGEGGVEPSGDSDHGLAAADVLHPGGQASHLLGQDFPASSVQPFSLRDERVRLDVSQKCRVEIGMGGISGIGQQEIPGIALKSESGFLGTESV